MRGRRVSVTLTGVALTGLAGVLTSAATAAPGALPSGPRPAAAPLGALSPNAPQPSPAELATVLDPLLANPALGGAPAVAVLDALTGVVLYDRAAESPLAPASTVKLVVAAAALTDLGPTSQITTRVLASGVVSAGSLAGDLVLQGGGDPTLTARGELTYPAPASLDALAAAVARSGIRIVTGQVIGDGSVFAADRIAPGWLDSDVTGGSVTPVSGLEVDEGRPAADPQGGPRAGLPDLEAALAFRAALSRVGVQVEGAVITGVAPAGARRVASVVSPPLAQMVERMLATSDNDLAESLGRLVALKEGLPATFAGVALALPAVLARAGLLGAGAGAGVAPPSAAELGLTLFDASGLSRDDRSSATLLARILVAAGDPRRPQLRPLLTGLPVADWTGTLEHRYSNDSTRAAAGRVRAKTGTLNGVSSLAGMVVDADGRLLVFVGLANNAAFLRGAELGLDRVAAAIAACGCRGVRP